ncbi:MAG TPA: hypothetical protein VES61_07115 [Gaiellaceae bacterium]|nr:hypothetical protein [Gaiellaceae bacterium]
MTVLLVDLAPGAVGAGLGVDEQPVEVEEQAADGGGGQVLDGWSVIGVPAGTGQTKPGCAIARRQG